MEKIRKIALLVLHDGRLLVVRKHGGKTWILPGGKPEAGESDQAALRREVLEELGCQVVGPQPYITCTSPAADLPGTEVTVAAYIGEIDCDPQAQQEIAEIAWIDINEPALPIAVSLEERILPRLRIDYPNIMQGQIPSQVPLASTSEEDEPTPPETAELSPETLASPSLRDHVAGYDDDRGGNMPVSNEAEITVSLGEVRELLAQNAQQQRQIETMQQALGQGAMWFYEYATQHSNKAKAMALGEKSSAERQEAMLEADRSQERGNFLAKAGISQGSR